jgi:hypothetical protein
MYAYTLLPLGLDSVQGPGAAYIKSLLDAPDSTAYRLAQAFQPGPLTAEIEAWRSRTLANARDWARNELAYDPYNNEVIRLLTGEIAEASPGDDAAQRALMDRLYRPYLRRFPSDANAWMAFANLGSVLRADPASSDRDLYAQNAIALSNHYPPFLLSYHEFKYNLFMNLVTLRRDRGLEPELDAADIDSRLVCPMIRLSRLYAEQCGDGPDRHGFCTGFWFSSPGKRAEIAADAAARAACEDERLAPADALTYLPMRPDWMDARDAAMR